MGVSKLPLVLSGQVASAQPDLLKYLFKRKARLGPVQVAEDAIDDGVAGRDHIRLRSLDHEGQRLGLAIVQIAQIGQVKLPAKAL